MADRRQEMQQMRGVKRSHDTAPPAWPGETKRPAVAADYPPSASRFACSLELHAWYNAHFFS